MKKIVLICSILLVVVMSACSSKKAVENEIDIIKKDSTNESITLNEEKVKKSEKERNDEKSDIEKNHQLITSNNLDYMTNNSFNEVSSILEEAELNYYVEYLKKKFSDKNKYKYNYTKEGKFRFLDEYYKMYIPGFCVDDIVKSMACEPGYENINLVKKIEMELHEHDIYGLLGVACIDIDNDDKMEMIIIESKPTNIDSDCCKFEYCFSVLSYDGEVHESNSVSIDPHYIPQTSFEYILAVRKIDNVAYLYWYTELYNDYDGDSWGRDVMVYCFKNGNIEEVGGAWLDAHDIADNPDEVLEQRSSFINKYFPENRFIKNTVDYLALCDISSKKINNDLDVYETANFLFGIRTFFVIREFNELPS